MEPTGGVRPMANHTQHERQTGPSGRLMIPFDGADWHSIDTVHCANQKGPSQMLGIQAVRKGQSKPTERTGLFLTL